MFDWFGHSFKTSDEAQCTTCIRLMFVFEFLTTQFDYNSNSDSSIKEGYPNSLILLRGVPESWYHKKSGFSCVNLPTFFGMIKKLEYRNQTITILHENSIYPLKLRLKYIQIHLPGKNFQIETIVSSIDSYEIKEDYLLFDTINFTENASITIKLREKSLG